VTHYIEKRLAAEAKPATINRELAVLRRAYNLGRRNRRILADHQPYIQMLKENNVRKGFVEPAQYEALVRELSKDGLWLRTLFECAYTWGFRKGELVISDGKGGLTVGQIDFSERLVRLEVGETKNQDGREVPMTNTIYELLKVLCEGKKSGDFVFTRDGKPVQSFRKTWRSAVKRAGLPNLLFHDLRRSAVRVMVRSGLNENVAMSISGHRTRSTFERYNIVSKKDKVEAMAKREQYLANVNKTSDVPVHAQSAHNPDRKPEKPSSKLLN
jgi:integrase